MKENDLFKTMFRCIATSRSLEEKKLFPLDGNSSIIDTFVQILTVHKAGRC